MEASVLTQVLLLLSTITSPFVFTEGVKGIVYTKVVICSHFVCVHTQPFPSYFTENLVCFIKSITTQNNVKKTSFSLLCYLTYGRSLQIWSSKWG